MIRSEREYQEARRRLDEEQKQLGETRVRLEAMKKFTTEEIQRVLDPLITFRAQLAEDVQSYERLMQGEIKEVMNLHGLGHRLIALRIMRGMTQRQLAKTLSVDFSQVSRDERNDYHGITVERASRILDALGVHMVTALESSLTGTGSQPRELVRARGGVRRHAPARR